MSTTTQSLTERLAAAAEAMLAGGAANLTQLLGAEVDFTLAEICEGAAVAEETPGVPIIVMVEFSEALEGESFFVLDAEAAATTVRMMTEGMDIAEEDLLGELGMSAISELMNQLMAGSARALTEALGELVNISPPQIVEADAVTSLPDDDVVTVVFDGRVGEDVDYRLRWQLRRPMAEKVANEWPSAQPTPDPPAEPNPAPATLAVAGVPDPVGSAMHVLGGVKLPVAVELGSVTCTIGELLRMAEGSVIPLHQGINEKATMLVNGAQIAWGEMVVVDKKLGFRITETTFSNEGHR